MRYNHLYVRYFIDLNNPVKSNQSTVFTNLYPIKDIHCVEHPYTDFTFFPNPIQTTDYLTDLTILMVPLFIRRPKN